MRLWYILAMISAIFTISITIVLPLLAFFYLLVKRRAYVVPFLVGVATFTIFQLLSRLPLIQGVLANYIWFKIFMQDIPLYLLFLSFTAALFEEGGRYIMMHFLLKRNKPYQNALAFGVGHWGIEALLIVGAPVLSVLIAGQADQVSWVAGLERLSTLPMHVCWSILVMRALQERKPKLLLLAMFFHCATNYLTIISYLGASVAVLEGILFVVGLGFAAYAVTQKRYFSELLEENVPEAPDGTEQDLNLPEAEPSEGGDA